MLKKLRLKFVLITMTIVIAMLFAIFATVYHFTKTDLNRQSEAMLDNLERNMRPAGFYNHASETMLPYFAVFIHLNGDIQVSGYTSDDGVDSELIRSLISDVYKRNRQRGELKEYHFLYSVSEGPGVQRIVFLDISSHESVLSGLVRSCALIGGGAILVFLLLSIFLARWAVKPVQQAWDQQKQFISDASHELKTPLTVILSNAELLQTNPEKQPQLTQNIVEMSLRMRRLVGQMLELARSDNGQHQIQPVELELSELVERAVLPFESVMFERNILMETNIAPGIRVRGSSEHLQQMLGVLLDNAAKYSSPGTVSVTLQRNGSDSCILCVANPGVPIVGQEQIKIFDRFYRGDSARTDGGRFGLGLPIAKSIAQSHKGQIWVKSNATGNCFCVQLPTI